MESVVGFLILISIALYFVPGVIASMRKHHQAAAIWILNILLGWTFLGWVAALVWSFTAVQASPAASSGSPES